MSKIIVKNPIVDITGDEMANVIWEKLKSAYYSIFRNKII